MWTGVVVAYIFTSIPEWTTWVLLVAMALYDLFAVLTPSGPLQMLVNLAMERDEDIPALLYEAREVRRPRRRNAAGSEAQAVAEGRTTARSGALTVFTPDSEAASDHLHSGGRLGAAEGHWGSGSSTSNSRGAYRGGRALGESQEGRPARQMGQGFGQIVDSELARLHRPPVHAPSSCLKCALECCSHNVAVVVVLFPTCSTQVQTLYLPGTMHAVVMLGVCLAAGDTPS